MSSEKPPVITIDGTSGCGKGTLAHRLAHKLGWHYLDSGALYRIAAWACLQKNIEPADNSSTHDFVKGLNIEFKHSGGGAESFRAYCEGVDVTDAIRVVDCSRMASKVSALPAVRAALLQQQLAFRQLPGLVTDGRDMGTVVFPDADVKLYLTANADVRARRRCDQLLSKGQSVDFNHIKQELIDRDERDMSRTESPLKPADDAVVIDTSELSVQQVYDFSCEYL